MARLDAESTVARQPRQHQRMAPDEVVAYLSGLYRRTGCLNAAQAAYWLGTRQLDSDATARS